jgi:hypothetical protein
MPACDTRMDGAGEIVFQVCVICARDMCGEIICFPLLFIKKIIAAVNDGGICAVY